MIFPGDFLRAALHLLINRPRSTRFSPTNPAFFFPNICNNYRFLQTYMEGTFSAKSSNIEESINLEDISLRPLDLSDVDDVMEWTTDEEVAKFCTWEPYTSKEQGMKFINEAMQCSWCRAICLNNRAVGCISVCCYSGKDEWRARTAELGYALGSKYWGKGIVTHVVKFVAKTVFSELPQVLRLEAVVVVENVGSQRVLEKAGFQREGVLRKYAFLKGRGRDLVMFSLLSTDYQASFLSA